MERAKEKIGDGYRVESKQNSGGVIPLPGQNNLLFFQPYAMGMMNYASPFCYYTSPPTHDNNWVTFEMRSCLEKIIDGPSLFYSETMGKYFKIL